MAEKHGVPLQNIAGFPPAVIQQLAGLWITTAEDLVSAAVREDGPQGLSQYLGMAVPDVAALVEQAVAVLPPGTSFAPGDVEIHGLGARDERPEGMATAVPFLPVDLPARVSLREKMPPVRNQAYRGTCVAHACVAVREYLLGAQSTQGDLSEQFLYWDCKQHDGMPNEEGTWVRIAMERLKVDGVCVESVWPYNPNPIPGNEGQGPAPAVAVSSIGNNRISSASGYDPHAVDVLRQQLAAGLPVAFSVPVYTYWFTEPVRSSGDLRMPLATDHVEGGHAMCFVGYEDDANVPGGGFFIVRNSWGTTWAGASTIEPGYARMPYAYMASYGSSAYTAKVDAAIPPVVNDLPVWLSSLLNWIRGIFGR